MLSGLTPQVFRKAVFSVGNAHGVERPLSPIEVAEVFFLALKAGSSRSQIGKAFHLDSSMVARFLRLRDLPAEIHHLVDWGKSKESVIGFSTASELCRVPLTHQLELADVILKFGVTKEETVSIAQLHERSGDTFKVCTERVLQRRPSVRQFQVVMGGITSTNLSSKLAELTQAERDKLLKRVMKRLYPKMKDYSAKLGDLRFTVVGEKSVGESIVKDVAFEPNVNTCLADALQEESSLNKGGH